MKGFADTHPYWFVRSDDNKPHLAGWMLSAIKGEATGTRPENNGWLGLAICPRCHAVVFNDDERVYSGQQSAHERWHAATDYPVPAEVLAESAQRSAEGAHINEGNGS